MELTAEEKKVLALNRKNKEKVEKCSKEIGTILKKHGLRLAVDPRSPINNMQIVLINA